MKDDEIARFLSGLLERGIQDHRSDPDGLRRGRFEAGWKDFTENKRKYDLDYLTWQNLGNRLGERYPDLPAEQIGKVFEIAKRLYEDAKQRYAIRQDSQEHPPSSDPARSMNVWWCNQSGQWNVERPEAVVCSSNSSARRGNNLYRKTVGEAKLGDLIVHYRKRHVVAFSRAQENGRFFEQLPLLQGEDYGAGWRFQTEYFDLQHPIHRESFTERLVPLRYKHHPINGVGHIRQGYFFPFDLEGLRVILFEVSDVLPAWLGKQLARPTVILQAASGPTRGFAESPGTFRQAGKKPESTSELVGVGTFDILVDPPERTPGPASLRARLYRSTKVDHAALDAANRALGSQGEEFIVEYERFHLGKLGRPDLAAQVRRISETKGDGAGYDVLSFDELGTEKYIEVKTTTGSKETPFVVTMNEVAFSQEYASRYYLYRLFDFEQNRRLFILNGCLNDVCKLEPVQFTARF
jgi:hypothetical protein